MKEIRLPSGFAFNFEHLYNEQAVTEADVQALAPAIEKAQAAAKVMLETGVVEGHLSKDGEPELVLFPQLPYIEEGHINSPAVMQKLYDLRDHARNDIDLVISLGIGGSYLGDKVLFDTHCGEFWNTKTEEERGGYPKVLFGGNNVDALRTAHMIDFVCREAAAKGEGYKVMLIIISKSGSTIEPMSALMVLEEAFEKHGIAYEVVAVTDLEEGEHETLLHKLATEREWPMFNVPNGVGGRFSVFTEVGLVLGAVVGFDIDAFLEGAKSMDALCRGGDIHTNPALLNATLKFIASEKYGRHLEVFMSYGDYLKSTSEWYVQLLAESLGKSVRRNGDALPYGRTPIVAVGTTDMHAQTQEHQEGQYNKVVQFLTVKDWGVSLPVPHKYEHFSKLAAFTGIELSDILQAAKDANEAALSSDHRFNATFELPNMGAYAMGELLFLLCWSIFYEGELASVDAFNQPGVEVYKKLLGPKLAKLKEALA